MDSPKKIYIIYAHKDKEYLDQLIKHLTVSLVRARLATIFDEHEITVGDEWDDTIKNELETADIILFLVSIHSIASRYIIDVELKTMIERHEKKEVIAIPIILNTCDWYEFEFAKIQALPRRAIPILSPEWASVDQAYTEITKEIKTVIRKSQSTWRPSNERVISIHFTYSYKDEEVANLLIKSLAPYTSRGLINIWHDKKILPGQEWDNAIKTNIESSDIMLLGISNSSLSSQYIREVEVYRSLERHEKKETVVIPILFEDCSWIQEPIAKLKALPHNGHPIKNKFWKNEAEAIKNIVDEISRVISTFQTLHKKEETFVHLSYAHEDLDIAKSIVRNLAMANRQGIKIWSDMDIRGGDEWDEAIKSSINQAKVVVLLLSSAFLASHYLYEVELEMAYDKMSNKEAVLLPIVIEQCDWKRTKLSELSEDYSILFDWVSSAKPAVDKIAHTCITINNLLVFLKSKLQQNPGSDLGELMIEYNKEIKNNPVINRIELPQKTKVFISYSWKDKEKVQDIMEALEKEDIEVVIDSKDFSAGGDLWESVKKSMLMTDVSLIVVSKNSLLSDWLIREVDFALKINEVQEAKRKIIGCYLDKYFEDEGYLESCLGFFKSEASRIQKLIDQRTLTYEGLADDEDLSLKKRNYKQAFDAFPKANKLIIRNLQVDLMDGQFKEGMRELIEEISKKGKEIN